MLSLAPSFPGRVVIDQKQPQPKAVTSSKPSISACATVVGNGDMFLQTATNGHGPPVLARFASETLEARLTTTPILGTRLCRGTRFQPDSQAAAKGTPLPGETIEKAAVRREHQGKKRTKKGVQGGMIRCRQRSHNLTPLRLRVVVGVSSPSVGIRLQDATPESGTRGASEDFKLSTQR